MQYTRRTPICRGCVSSLLRRQLAPCVLGSTGLGGTRNTVCVVTSDTTGPRPTIFFGCVCVYWEELENADSKRRFVSYWFIIRVLYVWPMLWFRRGSRGSSCRFAESAPGSDADFAECVRGNDADCVDCVRDVYLFIAMHRGKKKTLKDRNGSMKQKRKQRQVHTACR